MSEGLLCDANFLNFEKRTGVGFNSIEYFVNRYPFLNGLTISSEMGLLQEEFVEYQLLSDTDIPTDAARVGEDENVYYSWTSSGGSYLCATGSSELKLGRLCRVARVVLLHQIKSI